MADQNSQIAVAETELFSAGVDVRGSVLCGIKEFWDKFCTALGFLDGRFVPILLVLGMSLHRAVGFQDTTAFIYLWCLIHFCKSLTVVVVRFAKNSASVVTRWVKTWPKERAARKLHVRRIESLFAETPELNWADNVRFAADPSLDDLNRGIELTSRFLKSVDSDIAYRVQDINHALLSRRASYFAKLGDITKLEDNISTLNCSVTNVDSSVRKTQLRAYCPPAFTSLLSIASYAFKERTPERERVLRGSQRQDGDVGKLLRCIFDSSLPVAAAFIVIVTICCGIACHALFSLHWILCALLGFVLGNIAMRLLQPWYECTWHHVDVDVIDTILLLDGSKTTRVAALTLLVRLTVLFLLAVKSTAQTILVLIGKALATLSKWFAGFNRRIGALPRYRCAHTLAYRWNLSMSFDALVRVVTLVTTPRLSIAS